MLILSVLAVRWKRFLETVTFTDWNKEISKNGGVRFIEVKASPLMDASGNIVAGIEEVRDITECKSSEKKLRMFSVAIEEAVDGIQIVDLDGNILYSNKAAGLDLRIFS